MRRATGDSEPARRGRPLNSAQCPWHLRSQPIAAQGSPPLRSRPPRPACCRPPSSLAQRRAMRSRSGADELIRSLAGSAASCPSRSPADQPSPASLTRPAWSAEESCACAYLDHRIVISCVRLRRHIHPHSRSSTPAASSSQPCLKTGTAAHPRCMYPMIVSYATRNILPSSQITPGPAHAVPLLHRLQLYHASGASYPVPVFVPVPTPLDKQPLPAPGEHEHALLGSVRARSSPPPSRARGGTHPALSSQSCCLGSYSTPRLPTPCPLFLFRPRPAPAPAP